MSLILGGLGPQVGSSSSTPDPNLAYAIFSLDSTPVLATDGSLILLTSIEPPSSQGFNILSLDGTPILQLDGTPVLLLGGIDPALLICLTDPRAATLVLPGGTVPSRTRPRLSIDRGYADDFILQTWDRGSLVPSRFGDSDPVWAAIYQWRVSAPVCYPAASWYTAAGAQTGAAEGQVIVSLSDEDAAVLQPTGGALAYRLVIRRSPATVPGKSDRIVDLPLYVGRPY